MLSAIMLVLLAGGMNGSFAAPMKRVRGWQWEHTWLAWSLIGMIVLPLAIARTTIPDLVTVYQHAGVRSLSLTLIYGMIWGAGTVLFGLGIVRVGLALSFGIVLGTSSALGALLPLIMLHHDRLFTSSGALMLIGIGVILAGIAASAWAGMKRDSATVQHAGGSTFAGGLITCLLSGAGSSCMSLALNQSEPISHAAEMLGVPSSNSLNAVWPVLLCGGFIVNAIYCIFLLLRNGNVARFGRATGSNLALVVTMALLWSGSNVAYGWGARLLGGFGLILGWPIFMAAIVLTANVWGIVTGEWHEAGREAKTWGLGGCLLLVVGIWALALAGRLL